MATKICRRCGETKPLEDFHRAASIADGRRAVCKYCVSEARYAKQGGKQRLITQVCTKCGCAKEGNEFGTYKDKGILRVRGTCRTCTRTADRERWVAKKGGYTRQFAPVYVDPDLGLELKRCLMCGEEKPIDEYHSGDGYGGRRGRCKDCLRNIRGSRRRIPSRRFDPERGCEMKRCITCGTEKPINEVGSRSSGYVYSECKECRILRGRRNYWRDHAKTRAKAAQRWQSDHTKGVAAKYRRMHREIYRNASLRRRALIKGVPVSGVTREDIIRRDGTTCYLCGDKLDPNTPPRHPKAITIDHVLALARGGHHTANNLRVACKSCNSRKRDKLLSELTWYKGKI